MDLFNTYVVSVTKPQWWEIQVFFFFVCVCHCIKKPYSKDKCSWSWSWISMHLQSVYGALLRAPWCRTAGTENIHLSSVMSKSFLRLIQSYSPGKCKYYFESIVLECARTMQVTRSMQVQEVNKWFLLLDKRSSKVNGYSDIITWDNHYSISYMKGIHRIFSCSLECY